MTKLVDRLVQYMQFKGINNNQLTVMAGLSTGLIGNAINKKTGLNSDSIEKILHTCKDLNPSWLIIGEGEMLRELKQSTNFAYNEEKDIIIKKLEETVSILKSQVHDCMKDKEILRELLANLTGGTINKQAI